MRIELLVVVALIALTVSFTQKTDTYVPLFTKPLPVREAIICSRLLERQGFQHKYSEDLKNVEVLAEQHDVIIETLLRERFSPDLTPPHSSDFKKEAQRARDALENVLPGKAFCIVYERREPLSEPPQKILAVDRLTLFFVIDGGSDKEASRHADLLVSSTFLKMPRYPIFNKAWTEDERRALYASSS